MTQTLEGVFTSVSEEQLRGQLDERGLLTGLVEKAIDRANIAHDGQTRDNGAPFTEEHVFPITAHAAHYFANVVGSSLEEQEEAVITGLLHDTVEDSDYTLDQCEADFSPRIRGNTELLTKIKGESHLYIPRIMNGPEVVRAIKTIDRLNNMRSSVCMYPRRHDKMGRYIRETNEHYVPLAATLSHPQLGEELHGVVREAEGTVRAFTLRNLHELPIPVQTQGDQN